ncbi:hypothetical protein [Loktanella salsilacus]|uniref:hypothetical protein n=1 Tax=Loktanella salsilacus TaxID=195913 RepID=UPI003565D477
MPRNAACTTLFSAVLIAAFAPVSATAANLNFCWIGAGGYTMTGRMQLPDDQMHAPIVTQDDVTRFKISGYYQGKFLGAWDMSQAAAGTTWHMRFDPQQMAFLTGGSFQGPHSQGWNANGDVIDCGSPGFGFNSGNYAQDICVNGTYIQASSIDPATPLMATFSPVTPDCSTAILTSKSPIRESGD